MTKPVCAKCEQRKWRSAFRSAQSDQHLSFSLPRWYNTFVALSLSLTLKLALLFVAEYRKFPKYSDTQKVCCNHSKI